MTKPPRHPRESGDPRIKKESLMKALAKIKKEPGLWMIDADKPKIGPQDVLIKVKKAAICGTDLHIYNWDTWAQNTVPVPLITGHEFMGTVEAIGDEVHLFKVGDRVCGEGHLTCGECRSCRAGRRHLCRKTRGIGYHVQGAFAEYATLPEQNVYLLPNNISDDIGAILDPLGNAMLTAMQFSCVGEDVLITGAGPVGLMAAAIAEHIGARNIVVTDVSEYRLNLAKKMGVTRAVNANEFDREKIMKELGMREGFDVGLEMSGNASAFRMMLDAVKHGAGIALLGLPSEEFAINWSQVIFKSLTLQGVYGREIFETWYKMIALVQGGLDLTPIITHHFKFNEFEKAFEVMKQGQCGKIILEW